MNSPSPRRLLEYVTGRLGLQPYLESPGDGRSQPQIPAKGLLWSILIGQLLRECSFHSIEALVRSPKRQALGITRRFGDDALGYFTERLDPEPTRRAAVNVIRQAKRNKAFDDSRFIGLAVDGTTVGRCSRQRCTLCRPRRDKEKQILCYLHHFAMVTVVGTGLSLPFDVEPYVPGDSEYAAGQRLLKRAMHNLGGRFADYVVVDGGFATAPFLHAVGDLGLPVVARLKDNLPELSQAASKRFRNQPPKLTFRQGKDRIEVWDADDFDPWDTLRWETVRVLYYRQHKPNGDVFEAYWLTDLPMKKLSARSLFRMAKSRWEIENQGFNDAKSQHGLEHICHHHPNSLLMEWLLAMLALTMERLYRIRYLHRGTHAILAAMDLCRILWLSLSNPPPLVNTS